MDMSVYNNLLTTFEPKTTVKYAHDASELRSVVKRIRKQTQESPVYLVDFSDAKQSFVLGVKEASMKLNNSLQILADETENGLFAKKKARSSDDEQVEAELLETEGKPLPSKFSIRVKQLANAQVNQGKEFYGMKKGLRAGSYQFRVTVNDVAYDFQYNIRKDANNREVIEGLSGFITNAKIGINAVPCYHDSDKISMRLESDMVGIADGKETFSLQDKPSTENNGRGIVEYYGLDNVIVMPKNAVFDLNGVEKSSLNNEFTLGRVVRVKLHEPSEQEAVIDYHPDSDVIIGGIEEFVSHYNELIEHNVTFEQRTNVPSKLLRELKSLSKPFINDLESSGITFDEEGYMELDTSQASQAIEEGEMQKLFRADSLITNRLFAKADAVKINPMEYIDKKIVSYQDFTKPPRGYSYITSLYSGLLFNSYC